ncbi:MAG: hypothetical protein BHV77_13035 [Bacteroides sp. 43_108]|nr:MAG: hypothetical protein BHV77_13035 [Bacteroides sp. 43_108]
MKKTGLLFVGVLSLTALTSCGDAELAEKAEGTWQTTLNMKNEEGMPYEQTQIYSFTNDKNSGKDGGTFVEYLTNVAKEEEEGIVVNYTVTSTITGSWEVLFGDLCITYNLSSLDVNVNEVNYKLSDDVSPGMALDYWSASIDAAMEGYELIDRSELKKEIRKEVYNSLLDEYEKFNADREENGSVFADLKIENGIMSFMTSDVGCMEFKRVE